MTIKTISSFSCAICCVVIIFVALSTSHWAELRTTSTDKPARQAAYYIGLFSICEVLDEDTPNEEDKGCGEYNPPDSEKGPKQSVEGYAIARAVLVGTYVIALLLTLVAFIFVAVYGATAKYYFPIGRVAICFIASAICISAGLIWFTIVFKDDVISTFSWSYGAGWSAVGMYVITTVLLYADK